ncbi:DUF4333 domain-containing protein [Pseudonocardia tropica]|uniref:DUF4333 domain-containing protein n=1 Tax=Pseudonocardia tropica TaxID=681289 RepID=A0ABV1JQZ0_9PSEU
MSAARALAVLVASAGLLAAAGCSSSVPRDQVASTIATQLGGQGVAIDAGTVTCPSDLAAEVGRTLRCEFTTGGQPVDAVAAVSAVDGGTVNFDITTEARPVAPEVLARTVGEQVTASMGRPVGTTTCDGELAPRPGAVQTCTLTVGGEQLPARVTVTSVEGGLVNFSITDA